MRRNCILLAFLLPVILAMLQAPLMAVPMWTSPDRYRALLTVNPRGVTRKNSPAQVDIYFQTILGPAGTFDESTIEVVAYNASGQPKVFDATRPGYEQYLLPWRIQKYYPTNQTTLSFVMPDQTYTSYCVYFDTKQSGLGKPDRYPGMVGDGDWFTDGYDRREINACGYDSFCDFDNDGDLDLFKGGAEPYIFCYENVGGNRFVDRGRMTNGGVLMQFPMDASNRSWHSVSMCDWDRDGDQDMFIFAATGPYINKVIRYENTTPPGGPLTWTFRGILTTRSGKSPPSTLNFVDWDNDGRMDVLANQGGLVFLYINASPDNTLTNMLLEEATYVQANGQELYLESAQCEFADIDNDGDLDLFAGAEEGAAYFFKNIGTRSAPVFTMGRIIAFYEYMDARSRVKVADWDGDGLLDFVVGRFWERTQWGEEPRLYGRLYKNVGTLANPVFEARDAYHGAPYTERFQIADAVRQNSVRAVDWNNDGRTDLIACDTDGFVWYFRNTTNKLFPIFAPGERILANGVPIRMYGEEQEQRAAGYARCDIVDWNNDGKKDLLVADGRGWLWLYLNTGTDASPVFGAGQRVTAHNSAKTEFHPIDGNSRASVLVCDWNRDGKKDVIFGMFGYHPWVYAPPSTYSKYYDWPIVNAGAQWNDDGFLYYKNIGTDASPVLEYPEWVYAGGSRITSSRPNLGSFIDWDGDTKKDFIGCEFENSIRFFKNSTSSGNPTLAAFQTIVQPFTPQMCSGADAKDWNGDGDIDILTGQGHGGSGLRFYERDYINDFTGSTSPTTTVGASDHGLDISAAKLLADGQPVTVPQGIATASFTGYFYVEAKDRTSGIRVEKTSHGVLVGQRVDVVGSMATNPNGERYISATVITPNGSDSVAELAMGNRNLGGASLIGGSWGQLGVTNGVGLNNVGLLVKSFGKCTANLASTGDYYGARYLFIDDGSGVVGWYRAIGGSYQQVAGVKVEVNDASIAVNDYVAARGACSIESINGGYQARILPRAGMGDVVRM